MKNSTSIDFLFQCPNLKLHQPGEHIWKFSILNCSFLPIFISGLIVCTNSIGLLMSHHIKNFFTPTYSKCTWVVFLPSFFLSVIFFPIKTFVLAYSQPSMIGVKIVQTFIQTAYDGMILNLMAFNADMILALFPRGVYFSEQFQVMMRFHLFFIWLADFFLNFLFIYVIDDDQVAAYFALFIFPSTIYMGVASITFLSVTIFMFLVMSALLYYKIRNTNYSGPCKNVILPLLVLHLQFISFRLGPEIIRYNLLPYIPDKLYNTFNIVGFLEWAGLVLPPLIYIDFSNIFRKVNQRNEYEPVGFWNSYEYFPIIGKAIKTKKQNKTKKNNQKGKTPDKILLLLLLLLLEYAEKKIKDSFQWDLNSYLLLPLPVKKKKNDMWCSLLS